MLKSNKRVGETPLEFLDRLRIEKPELKDSVLSYAGRLDPMAEGEMLIIVDEENKEREKYLGLDKEYEATFLFGVSTDSGDILGLIENESTVSTEISFQEISVLLESFLNLKTQKYPWFSSKTVLGIKLFEYFKSGKTDIERPSREIQIKKADLLKLEEVSSEELKKYIFESIQKVKGDFRQKETLEKWTEFFKERKTMQICQIKLHVSSGTYIRGLTELFPVPTTLLKLSRTKIFT